MLRYLFAISVDLVFGSQYTYETNSTKAVSEYWVKEATISLLRFPNGNRLMQKIFLKKKTT